MYKWAPQRGFQINSGRHIPEIQNIRCKETFATYFYPFTKFFIEFEIRGGHCASIAAPPIRLSPRMAALEVSLAAVACRRSAIGGDVERLESPGQGLVLKEGRKRPEAKVVFLLTVKTRRWREEDSNPRSPPGGIPIDRSHPLFLRIPSDGPNSSQMPDEAGRKSIAGLP